MTEARAKSETLSETCKSYLSDVFIKEKYGRVKDISNKYLEKGIQVEEDSITLLSRFSRKFYNKNEDTFKNDFISGTPDILDNNCVIDIKSSWDIFTFFKSKEELNKMYYWQLQGYMALTGATRAELVYCLVDTPEHILEAEKRKLAYKLGEGSQDNEEFKPLFENLEKLSKYLDIPVNERVFVKQIERNEKDIERIYSRVLECREYLKNNFNL